MVLNVLGAKQEDTDALATVRAESVQDLWNAQRDGAMGMWLYSSQRGPILPAWGTRDRERALRGFYRHEYSTLLQGAFMGLIKKVRATPWEIEGGRNLTNKYQGILRESQFRAGWGDFLSRFLLDYLRQDGGAWAEIIAPGDPLRPPTGPITGLAHLDSLWTWPTGDPEYPCVYWSRLGKLHLMHHTRVLHMVDMPDGDQFNPGYGLCALSRAIAVVQRQLYLNRYIVSNLDDLPSPGAVVANNLTRQEVEKAFALFQQQQDSDNLPAWGKVAWLYNLDATKPGTLENFSFSRPPEKFDFPVYVQIDIDELALAIGVDVQDLRPISSGNVGTAKQTEVMHAKAEGKTFGDILISLERLLNDVLPEALEFQFKTRDMMAAEAEANVAQIWVGVATSAASIIGNQLAAQLLADNVEQFREVLTDEAGQTIELTDLDPQPASVSQQVSAQLQPQLDAQAAEQATTNDRTPQAKKSHSRSRCMMCDAPPTKDVKWAEGKARAWFCDEHFEDWSAEHLDDMDYVHEVTDGTVPVKFSDGKPAKKDFEDTRARYVSDLVDLLYASRDDDVSRRRAGTVMRAQLSRLGKEARLDGLREGGVTTLSDADLNAHTVWLAKQSPFVSEFLTSAYRKGLSDAQIQQHAQMWANVSLQTAFYEGVESADKDGVYEFTGTDGLQSCPTCQSLEGRKMTMSQWTARQLRPGADTHNYKCGGYQCKHHLRRVTA